MTRPTWLNRAFPLTADGLLLATGGCAERIVATYLVIASCSASRPELANGRKLVTPGGFESCRPRRATDRLPRVAHVPLGVPAGPAVAPWFAAVYSKIVVWSAAAPSTPPT